MAQKSPVLGSIGALKSYLKGLLKGLAFTALATFTAARLRFFV